MSYTIEDLIRLYYYHTSSLERDEDEIARPERDCLWNQHWILARIYLRKIKKGTSYEKN